MSFSSRLKELRLSLNLTQRQVYEAVGMSPLGYQRYEYGEREPTFEKLSALAEFFNVPADFLLERRPFEHWEELQPHMADLRFVTQQMFELPDGFTEYATLPEFIQFFAIAYGDAEVNSEDGTITLHPRIPFKLRE